SSVRIRCGRNYIVTRQAPSTSVARCRSFCALEILATTMPSSSSMSTTGDSTSDVRARLRADFGHPDFRPGQEAIVAAVLDGFDVLAVMPTGSGKSLGYQLPAVVLPGTTLVVSPLISLMKDQVDELNRRGIPSGALHSMLPPARKQEVLRAARAGALRLLYVAPERFASEPFLDLLEG